MSKFSHDADDAAAAADDDDDAADDAMAMTIPRHFLRKQPRLKKPNCTKKMETFCLKPDSHV